MIKQFSAEDVELDSHYHIPKPSRNMEYHVPRPHDDSRNRGDYYHQPKPAEETYKVPKPYSKGGPETYDSPKHTHSPSAQPVYNTPKAIKEESDSFYTNVSKNDTEQTQENFYNVPRTPTAAKTHAVLGGNPQQEPGNLYSIPTKRGGSEKQSKFSALDLVDGGHPPILHKLRSARSAESLFTRRINHNSSDSHISPPDPASEHNMYVDIEQNRKVHPMADNLYAEIPADYIPRRVQIMSNGGENVAPQQTGSAKRSAAELYDQVPNRMDTQIQNQRKLAREGYELCLPAEVDPNSLNTMTLPGRGKRASASPPRMLQDRGSSLDKYDIHMPTARPARPRSEADLLDSVEKSGSTHNQDILGSSIPTNSTFPIADEYVIITHRDTRPKFPPTLPQGIPGSSESGSQVTNQNTVESDEYQTMTAAKIDRSKFLYDTPNPSLIGNGHQSNTSHTNSQPTTVQDVQYETVSLANYSRLDSESSLDMEGVSPRNSRPLDQVRSYSFSSRGSVFNDHESEVEGETDHVTGEGMAIQQKVRMRIASGSPRDASTSLELK